jgi:hypothetical protein
MTELSIEVEDFQNPSELASAGSGNYPALSQLRGRLLWVKPILRKDNQASIQRPEPHTVMVCDMAFLDGPAIAHRLDKDGDIHATFDEPVNPGDVIRGMYFSQGWFVSRLKDRAGDPTFPGLVGILGKAPARTGQMWVLTDPSPAQMTQLRTWAAWQRKKDAEEAAAKASAAPDWASAGPVSTGPAVSAQLPPWMSGTDAVAPPF